MRTREEINNSMVIDVNYGTATDRIKRASELSLEVLLDIRDILNEIRPQVYQINSEVNKSSQYIRR